MADEQKGVETAGETTEATEPPADEPRAANGAGDAAKPDPTQKRQPRGLRPPRVSSLYRALRSGRPQEGTVDKVIKGGYEVKLGKARGFCPHSQIDLKRVELPEHHVGRTYYFRVTQVRRGGQDVVVSRRAVLEDERAEEASAVRATLIEGAVMQGRVAGMAEFGAFVDLGAGVMGLVHVSELSHSRVVRVADTVTVGDPVSVKIMKIHDAGKKVSLSIRQAEGDPWADVETKFKPGRSYPGVIRRLTQFGAFVELEPGIEALAPASEFPPSPSGWKTDLEIGGSRDWLILSVDSGQRRISVAPPADGVDPQAVKPLEIGAMCKGKVQRVENYGVFVWLGPGRVGLMPNAWSGQPKGAPMHKHFRHGDEVEVEVRELADEGRRIRLARKGVEAQVERGPRAPRAPNPPRREKRAPRPPALRRPVPGASAPSFGTSLGDKLRAALGEAAKR